MIAYGRGKEALACTGRSRDEEILPLPHEVEREQPFHLVLVKPAADIVVNILGIGVVAEGGPAYEPVYGCRGAVVPLSCHQPGDEAVGCHGLGIGGREAFPWGIDHRNQVERQWVAYCLPLTVMK